MPFNVLFLPLLGGYLFITFWNRTRFDARRYSGHRLIFHAAEWGVGFLAVSFLATSAVRHAFPSVFVAWRSLVPYPGTGTGLLAFVLGGVLWIPLNRFFPRDEQARAAIERWGNFLELLLNRSMEESSQVALTLSNGKFYVGYVTAAFDPAYDREYARILPTLSGYRRADTHEVVFTTSYVPVYENLPDLERADRFQLVVPIAAIVSANLFQPELFGRFDDGGTATATAGEAGAREGGGTDA